jgi:hypothetical protein
MAKLVVQIMDKTGHSTLELDRANPADLEHAQRIFEKCLAGGGLVATKHEGATDYTVAKKFDQVEDVMRVQPQLKGG